MKRVALHTLGCKLNFAETATLGKQFLKLGYTVVGIDEPADVVVLNTCSVTERADRECRQLVRRVLRHSPLAYVAVVGCYAQLQPDEIAAIPGVDLVLGSTEKFNLLAFAGDFKKESRPVIAVSSTGETREFGYASSAGFSERTRAFLKIQDGCDYNCAFCTIPLARGSSRSVSVPEVVRQARGIVEQGYREIVLTGVNVGDFGRKLGTDLLSLLRDLVKIDGLDRLRISSIEPNLLTDSLLDLWFTEPKLCNHWHIPLQGGTDELLKGMRRRYQTQLYRSKIERIKSEVPHGGIGADVIVGSPGESEPMFIESYKFIADLPVSYLHVFPYSERPHTPAANLGNCVEPRIRTDRAERLRLLSARKRRSRLQSLINSTRDVLFETPGEDGWMSGLTEEYDRVNVRSSVDLTNQILSVKITSADSDRCIGELSVGVSQKTGCEGVFAW